MAAPEHAVPAAAAAVAADPVGAAGAAGRHAAAPVAPVAPVIPVAAAVAVTAAEAAGRLRARVDPAHARLTADSRHVRPGDGFFAWAGAHVDARRFVAQAVQAGAAVVLVDAGEGEGEDGGGDGDGEGDGAAGGSVVPDASATTSAGRPAEVLRVRALRREAGPIAAHWAGDPTGAMAVVAVTGTNGKTSTTHWIASGENVRAGRPVAAVVGTLGFGVPERLQPTGLTTPTAVELQQQFAQLRDDGIRHVAIEASSIGLAQHRLDGTRVRIAALTNLSRDHLDVHGTMQQYEAAKARLFDWPALRAAVLPLDDAAGLRLAARLCGVAGAGADANAGAGAAAGADIARAGAGAGADVPAGADPAGTAAGGALHVTGYALADDPDVLPDDPAAGASTDDPSDGSPDDPAAGRDRHGAAAFAGAARRCDRVLLGSADDVASPWPVVLHEPGRAPRRARLQLRVLGRFNRRNVLMVAAVWLASGWSFDEVVQAVQALEPVPGRMQMLGAPQQCGQPLVVVDYAHTPDALDNVLAALRPVAAHRGGRLWCVFGAGGDRDPGKRAPMAAAVAAGADRIVLTSDNPRSEDPALILAQLRAGLDAEPWAIEPDRGRAIARAVAAAQPADVVLLAGKGHEEYQEIGGRRFAFSDLQHARQALHARAAGVPA